MYLKREVAPSIIWYFSWRTVAFATVLAAGVTLLYQFAGLRQIGIPFLPIATIGTAVAFYVGFKNNSSYDRLWEARKIWGELTNVNRALASYLLAVVKRDSLDQARIIVLTQIAYVNMLRLQLRRRNIWDDKHLYTQMVAQCFPTAPYEEEALIVLTKFAQNEDSAALLLKKNAPKEILHSLMRQISALHAQNALNDFQQSDLLRMCADLFAQQGKAERIKSFPFPRQYAYFSEVFIRIFMCLLPFGLVQEFAKLGPNAIWMTIPFTALIAWIFDTMEKVGDTSENPFENGMHDVPMTAICRNIEIDLLEMLGDTDLPLPMQPVDNILM
jgi:putative membrane protein